MSTNPARHAGARRAERPSGKGRLKGLLLALAVLVLVVAWVFLVKAAIDFGTNARGGDGQAWLFLAIATLGAVACLFAGLILGARLLEALGLSRTAGTSTGRRKAGK